MNYVLFYFFVCPLSTDS